ncbi:MAG: tetratricopeptide (TPR) repeat protein [Gammaproteobacteria bacterium]|jgi:tetratricopeptide (TPR) repeat protein
MPSMLIRLFLLFFLSAPVYAFDVLQDILPIQKQWAQIKYQLNEDDQPAAYERLIENTNALIQRYPDRAEPKVWAAIVYSSYAGAVGGIKSITSALPAVKKAHNLLQNAQTIDDQTLDGSVFTSLGALYYQVPGWPIGFGDKKKAARYLEKAIRISKNGLDANYFYGDYLVNRKRYKEAIPVLERALTAPPIENRPVADQGRRHEITQLLEYAKNKLS